MPSHDHNPGTTRPADPQRLLPARIEAAGGVDILHLREASLMDPSVIALAGHVEKLGGRQTPAHHRFRACSIHQLEHDWCAGGCGQSVVREHGRLVLAGLNRRLNELLKITRLDKMFTVEPDVQAPWLMRCSPKRDPDPTSESCARAHVASITMHR